MTPEQLTEYKAAHKDCPDCLHPWSEHRDGSCLSDDPAPCWCDGWTHEQERTHDDP